MVNKWVSCTNLRAASGRLFCFVAIEKVAKVETSYFLARKITCRKRRKRKLDIKRGMVEPDGIEPTTSCLQSTRSPS